jgi:hypothetical protein
MLLRKGEVNVLIYCTNLYTIDLLFHGLNPIFFTFLNIGGVIGFFIFMDILKTYIHNYPLVFEIFFGIINGSLILYLFYPIIVFLVPSDWMATRFTSFRIVISWTLMIGITLFWFITKDWIAQNVLVISLATAIVGSIFLFNLKQVSLLGLIVWLYYSSIFTVSKNSWFNNNTNIPFNLIFPTNNFQYEIIGFPNLVIPGILMTYCIRFDIFKYGKTFTTFGYFAVSVILYLFGLALALWTPLFSLQPLPEVIILLPIMFIGIWLFAFLRNEMEDLSNFKNFELPS